MDYETHIDVKDFNLSETPYNQAVMKMGWMDALTINVKGQKLLDAKDFIKFVISQKDITMR